MSKRRFTTKGYKAKEYLDLMPMDMCGPFNVHIQRWYEYFTTFIDECSKFWYVYLVYKNLMS